MYDREESDSPPLPLQEGVPQVKQTRHRLHSFTCSFRWYQPRCSPRTGTLGTFEVLDSDPENHEKSMFVKSTREALSGTREWLEMFYGVSESSWMIHDDFREVRKIMIFMIYHA